MSIFSTWLRIDDHDHEPACGVYERIGPAASWPDDAVLATPRGDGESIYYRASGKPCTCPNKPPIIYQGSHVNPADDHPRGGTIDIAAIPNFCHPDVREARFNNPDAEDDMRFPVEFLRLSVTEDPATYHGGQPGDATLVLDRTQVEKLRDTLTRWLETKERY